VVSAAASTHVSADGWLNISVIQRSQNQAGNSSQVQVIGGMLNAGSSRSFHLDKTISCSINGAGTFNGAAFSFDLAAGQAFNFIDHTFTIVHGPDGIGNITFQVHYGVTGTATFGDNKTAGVFLALTRIPKRPNPPGVPTFSNEFPTTMTVSWTASPNNQGSAINDYLLRQYSGTSPTGPYVDNHGNSLTRNLTGLIPGAKYTYTVYAHNGSADNGGYSNPSGSNTLGMLAGAWVRVSGVWKIAVPYIRVGGVWMMAVPYVRSGGTWKLTN
jgi:hypothetical protein